VIVATNVDLAKAMQSGTFREDLYYRLNVVEVAIPPLRERREDIPQLLDLFVEKYGRRYGRNLDSVPRSIVERFLTYDFPGNIRELENLVRRLMVLRDPRYVLSELKERTSAAAPPAGAAPASTAPPTAAPTLPPIYGAHGAAFASPFNSPSPLPPPTIPPPPAFRPPGDAQIAQAAGAAAANQAIIDDYRIDLKDLGRKAAHAAEREAIIIMLGHTGGNKREAAERLGISYKAILYKIREFGIGRPRGARPAREAVPPPTQAADAAPNVVVPTPDTWQSDPPPDGGEPTPLPLEKSLNP
jgi:DNA-binding NtrC family response regulator